MGSMTRLVCSLRWRRWLLAGVLWLSVWPLAQAALDDHAALQGLKAARVVFDVRVADQDKLDFNLALIQETFDGLLAQGVVPQMVVTFRGPGVRLLNAAALDDEARGLFRDLVTRGVRFEACGIALRVYKVDPSGLIPEVKPVANGFNSLIGYQAKGYATIAIN